MESSREDLEEAKRQIDSTLHKKIFVIIDHRHGKRCRY